MGCWCHWFDPLLLSEGYSTCALSWVTSLCWNKYITDCYNLWTTVIMQIVLFWNLPKKKTTCFQVSKFLMVQWFSLFGQHQLWCHLISFSFFLLFDCDFGTNSITCFCHTFPSDSLRLCLLFLFGGRGGEHWLPVSEADIFYASKYILLHKLLAEMK